MVVTWRDRLQAFHEAWCTPGRIVALYWTCAVCWGALVVALFR